MSQVARSCSDRRHTIPRLGRRVAAALICVIGLTIAAPALQSQPAPGAASAKHFLWKVEGRKTPLFLLGSVHLLSSRYYPLAAAIEDAFESAGTLVEEIDLDEMTSPGAMTLMMSKAMYQDGETLDRTLSRETYARLVKYLQSAGLPVAPMNRLKPWMIALTLTSLAAQKAGLDPNLGIDKHFFDKAKKAGKTVQALETVAYQIERLDGIDAGTQEEWIRQTLDDSETQQQDLAKLLDAWAAGDTRALEALLLEASKDAPRIHERLVVERNRNWLPALDICLDAPKPCFVVVGAAHMVGPDGLVALLRKKGLSVTQK